MSAVQDVAARLVEVVEGLPVAALVNAAGQLDAVVVRLGGVAEGSGSEDLWNAVRLFAAARDAAAEAVQALEAVGEHLGVYVSALGVSVTGGVCAGDQMARAVRVARSGHGPEGQPEALLAGLPAWSAGAKTRGVWVDSRGDRRELVSGKHDRWYGLANRRAVELGLVPQGTTMTAAAHVELKFATQMRQAGILRAVIAINNRPCPGELGCHARIGQFLPDGGELTVYGPSGFVHTYQNRRPAR